MLIEFMAWRIQQLRDRLARRLARRDAFSVRSLGRHVARTGAHRGVERPFAWVTPDGAVLCRGPHRRCRPLVRPPPDAERSPYSHGISRSGAALVSNAPLAAGVGK
jgi:hypothetical protein